MMSPSAASIQEVLHSNIAGHQNSQNTWVESTSVINMTEINPTQYALQNDGQSIEHISKFH